MSPNLKISTYVINVCKIIEFVCRIHYMDNKIFFLFQRLSSVSAQYSGCLYGTMYDGTLLVVGFNLETFQGSDYKSNYSQIQNNFPTEVYLCGLVKFGDCSDTQAHLKEILLVTVLCFFLNAS